MRKLQWWIGLCLWLASGGLQGQPSLSATERDQQRLFLLQDTQKVLVARLPRTINSPYSEYNAFLSADSTLFFTSLRPETQEDCENFFEPFWTSKIYSSKLTVSGYSTPKPLPAALNSLKYYNCNFSFNRDASEVYFSRCLTPPGDEKLQCEVWHSQRKSKSWETPKRLSRKINLPGTTTTQPCLVEYDDCQLLFFVSDRPFGFGGLDIWYSVCKNGRFGDPINLGSLVNTSGNEATPFYDAEHKKLYFSSTGHLALGGYDIFVSAGEFSTWSAPQNLGVPINSPHNDLYFSLRPHDVSQGFFSSNRPTDKAMKNDTCCHDVYAFTFLAKKDSVQQDSIDNQTDTILKSIPRISPLTLYFHNDEPNPKSLDTTTALNYQNTLADYLEMKEIYQKEYSAGLKNEEKQKAEAAIAAFFRDSLEQSFQKLERFTARLCADLKAGKEVEVTIAGFASPLHNADYNYRLSARRIVSLRNYWAEYGGGLLLPYLNGTAANRLTIHALPKGNSMAQTYVSDNVHDKRNSVYSIAASLERKIQIIRYECK